MSGMKNDWLSWWREKQMLRKTKPMEQGFFSFGHLTSRILRFYLITNLIDGCFVVLHNASRFHNPQPPSKSCLVRISEKPEARVHDKFTMVFKAEPLGNSMSAYRTEMMSEGFPLLNLYRKACEWNMHIIRKMKLLLRVNANFKTFSWEVCLEAERNPVARSMFLLAANQFKDPQSVHLRCVLNRVPNCSVSCWCQ